jgi:hypothetical protein
MSGSGSRIENILRSVLDFVRPEPAHRYMKPLLTCVIILFAAPANAHHVLGRPAYSLNEDSNTPPSMEVETQIGHYYVTYMVFPAFPKAGERGRVNLYAKRIDNAEPYNGEVTFKVKDDVLFGDKHEETLGSQLPDDSVYRQGFEFSQDGKYIITAEFSDGGEPYIIDFPLQIGSPASVGPLGYAVGAIVFVLVGVNLVQRKRLLRAKLRNAHEEMGTESS